MGLTELQVNNLPSSSSSQWGLPPSMKQVLHGEHAALLVLVRFFFIFFNTFYIINISFYASSYRVHLGFYNLKLKGVPR